MLCLGADQPLPWHGSEDSRIFEQQNARGARGYHTLLAPKYSFVTRQLLLYFVSLDALSIVQRTCCLFLGVVFADRLLKLVK